MGNGSRLDDSTWRRIRELVLIRDNFKCYVCGGPANTVDHITARKLGGTHNMRNLAACCATHNTRKGDRPPSVPFTSRVW